MVFNQLKMKMKSRFKKFNLLKNYSKNINPKKEETYKKDYKQKKTKNRKQ